MAPLLNRLFDNDWVGPALVCLVAVVGISILQPSFLSPFNILVLLSAIAVNMVIALGQLVIIAIGQMNLALGAFGGLVAICFVAVMELYGVPPVLAAGRSASPSASLAGAASRLRHRAHRHLGLHHHAGGTADLQGHQPRHHRGAALLWRAAEREGFRQPRHLRAHPVARSCRWSSPRVGMWYLFNRLRIGRYILAVGGNRTAAELSGINVTATIIWAHAISGLLAAIAGMMLVARLQIGQPTIGDDWLISSFAAPVIGGAVLAGGHVSVAGTFFGVVIIAIITQALVLFAIDPFVVQIVLGALILWAVGINRLREVRVAKLNEAR